MPSTGSIMEGILYVGIAVVVAWYMYEVVLQPWISKMMSGSQEAKREKMQERAYELLNQYHREANDIYGNKRDISQAAPSIKLIRAAEHQGAVTCLFVNRGGTARDLAVEPYGAFSATMTPQGELKHDQTGRVTLQHIASSNAPLEFELSYKNTYGERECRRYQYQQESKAFREL